MQRGIFMAQQIINVGNSPNDGLGDPIRTSFEKTNSNFTELYSRTAGVEVPGVYYVAPIGNDTNSGKNPGVPFLTIKAAVTAASAYTALNASNRSTIFVAAGNYTENNPVVFGTRVTVVWDNLRSVSVLPLNAGQDIFHLRNGCYITGITFRSFQSPAAAIAFPADATPVNNVITTSPYVQNCSCMFRRSE
jgi:hypothetical protein